MLSLGGFASLSTSLTGNNNDLVFTAKEAGTEANSIRVRYVDPGAPSASLSVGVSGNDITVNLATDGSSVITSTATQVKDAVNAHATAKNMVSAALKSGNDGTGVVTALAFTNLANGTDGEMRAALPPNLTPGPSSPAISGKEEQNPNDAGIEKTATVRVSDRSSNRSLRKR
jgi:hypothetical protein